MFFFDEASIVTVIVVLTDKLHVSMLILHNAGDEKKTYFGTVKYFIITIVVFRRRVIIFIHGLGKMDEMFDLLTQRWNNFYFVV